MGESIRHYCIEISLFFRVDQASGLELLFMKKYKIFLETSIFGQVWGGL